MMHTMNVRVTQTIQSYAYDTLEFMGGKKKEKEKKKSDDSAGPQKPTLQRVYDSKERLCITL